MSDNREQKDEQNRDMDRSTEEALEEETTDENGETEKTAESENPEEAGDDTSAKEPAEEDDLAEQEEDEEESDTEASDPDEKKGLFKKKKKEKKDKKDEQIAELKDQVMRQLAEFDNFRKRTEKEKSQMFEIGAKSIIEKVLPVLDNFERGLAAVPEEQQEDAFVDGMNKVYKQMLTMLEEAGVTPIEAVGKEFNPDLHNAVMQTEDSEYESGIVTQELQKGYMYRDSVVRHSMVAVAS